MNKRLGLFIAIVVILIVIAGTIGIKEVMEPTSSEVIQREIEELDIEKGSYVIGKHLFTKNMSYISKAMILEAAKTVPNIEESMTEEEIFSKITVYAKDEEGNWINALTGESVEVDEGKLKENIEFIDAIKPSEAIATEEEFITAFGNEEISSITLGENITLNNALKIENGKDITVDLNGKVLNITNIGDKSNFSMEVNGGNLVINGPGTLITHNSKTNIGNMEGKVTINNVSMIGGYNILANFKNQGGETTTIVNNSELEATAHTCVGAWENATIEINNSTLEGKYSAVGTNGTAKSANINILNCNMSTTCEEEACVAYMPCGGEMNIEDSILTGHTGLGACAGTVNVTNTKINATGKHWSLEEVQKLGSEMWCEGSSVILRSQKGYNDGGKLILNIDETSKISSVNGPAIRIHEYKENTTAVHGVNNIEINYYSANSTCNSSFEKVLIEKLENSFVTVDVNDLSE